jgi:hypothetical protein
MSDNATSITSIADAIRSFTEAFQIAREGFIRAGQIYAAAIDRFGQSARDQFATGAPAISAETWRRLERLGRGEMDHRLLTKSSEGARALRRLTPGEQGQALDHGVPLLLSGGDHLLVQVDALTRAQVHQVFAMDHVRDLGEQRAWLETHAPQITAPRKVDAPAYRIVGGRVKIERPCELSRADVLRLMAELG